MENNGAADATSPSNTDAGSGGSGEEAQAVKVAVHIRPLIGGEIFQGCKDCVSLVSGEPQVQIGSHSFTFDHVYGSTGSPSCAIFEECVSPLVEGLFQGYNATVLAYGQTGSGKTYTMGTGYTVGGSTEGVIPKAMELIFRKVAVLKKKAEFQIRVSFIEILKEEVHDLLDPNPPIAIKSDSTNCFGSKTGAPGKPPIQIRENTNGEITLAGVTEIDVGSLEEMAACLEQGSLCRATASTNMNSRSSRSHAIFTITLEQKRILDLPAKSCNNCTDDVSDDFLCAKLHLVDLAGSERAKRTGADGVRFKEGVHINKGLLALGNVISALGDDKKRKEGGHVPYRDSKLTRLLQDSLGGNSRTVMIACISPADSNAEETLNTLKYANRARNIQNKPVVNRDPMAAEMQRMRQQVELLQAELLCIRTGGSFEEIQILKQRTAWLETSLLELQQELQIARGNLHLGAQHLLETQVERDKLQLKLDMLRSGKTWEDVDDGGESQGAGLLESYAERIKILENEVQQLRNACPQTLVFQQQQYQSRTSSVLDTDLSILSLPEGVEATEMEEETVAKEMEHARLQDSLDKELEELNKKLEQKEAEMKTFAKCDGVVLKQHFERKIVELEEEKKVLQSERDTLMAELTSLTNTSDEQSQKRQETYIQKVKALEAQISELKKKQENQTQLLKQKQRSDEAAKRLQDEIQRIKTQKVQLQHKIKQESEQFRLWKALREKEVLQLKKEGRRNEYEMHKLQALNQRQKMVLQRKTEEAALAMRRLKDLLEARKPSSKENSVPGVSPANGSGSGVQANEKSLQQWLDHELEVAVHIHEVRNNYEKQTDSRAALAKELAKLKQEQDIQEKQPDIFSSRTTSMSPGARQAKIALLESMLNASSSTLVAMASQLSEAEERERAFSGRARWQHVRSMVDAKNLLQYIFSSAVDARCKYWDKELENKELKEKISELTMLLKQSESHRQERDRQQFAKEQYIAKLLTSAMKAGTNIAIKSCFDEISKHMLQLDNTGPRHLEYPDDCSDVSAGGNSSLPCHLRKASRGPLSNHSTDPDASDVSEGEESDMDIDDDIDDDASDEDWSEVGEKRPSRSRIRKIKGDKSHNGFQDLAPTRGEIVEAKAKSRPDSPLCCSCSRSSGCKTSKCACKAAGSLCGLNCGCLSKKCANRESGLEEGEAAEVAEAIETLKLDKEIRNVQRTQVECDQIVADAFIKKEDVQRAEQVLAKHGAAVLENVWTDELETVGSAAKSGHTVDGNFHPGKGNFRRPLSDIGNNAQAEEVDGQPKMKQRKRWGKALVQLVPTTATAQHPTSETAGAGGPRQPHTGRQHDIQPVAENAIETGAVGLDTTNIPADSHHALPRNETGRLVPYTTEAEGLPQSQYSVGLQRDFKLQRNARKKSSPPSSPLRARNIHAAAGSVEEGSGLSKRLTNSGSSASPRAAQGKGGGVVREKENV